MSLIFNPVSPSSLLVCLVHLGCMDVRPRAVEQIAAAAGGDDEGGTPATAVQRRV